LIAYQITDAYSGATSGKLISDHRSNKLS